MSAVMLQQDDWLEPTRERLRSWANWLHAGGGVISSAGLTGSYCERTDRGFEPGYDDNDSEVIDRILCRVRDRDRVIYQALYDYYYHSDNTRSIAENLRVSKTKVLDFIKQGETMVSVWWDAIARG